MPQIKRHRLILSFFLLCILNSYASNPTKNPKDVKILILIIASNNLPIYIEEEKIWRSYMHTCPKNIEAYFIRANPNLKKQCVIEKDTVWSKTSECVVPGILNKTMLSLKKFSSRLENEFDYVLRTNLSSFYILPRLIKYVQTLPRKNCYIGPVWPGYENFIPGLTWVSGHGIIMSSDLALKLCSYSCLIDFNKKHGGQMKHQQDDVVLAWFIKKTFKIPAYKHPWMFIPDINTWEMIKNSIPENIFLFRTKDEHGDRMINELYIHKQLRDQFYPK